MHIFASKKICWFVIFIFIFVWSGMVELMAYSKQKTRIDTEDAAKMHAQLKKLFEALDEISREVPRESFDPKAIIQAIGSDLDKIFEWVRDETYLVPYQGSLRGPIGVLMDRLGNSLDRALLLYELLTLSGQKARLARGTLSSRQAKELLDQIKKYPPKISYSEEQNFSQSLETVLKKYAQKYQFDQSEMKKYIDQMLKDQDNIATNFQKKVREHTNEIISLIGSDQKRKAPESDTWEKALRDHWWVQAERDGKWLDLDVNLQDSKPGKALTVPKETCLPEEIDESLFHAVILRMVIERLKEGKLEEAKVLEYRHIPSKKFGEKIVVRHLPLNWPEDFDLYKKKASVEATKKAVLEQKEWQPVLTIGPDKVSASSFKDTGEINKTPGKKSPSVGITRGLFRALAGGEEKEAEEKSQLTAEWLEYEVQAPGRPFRRARRAIFDLLGPAAREHLLEKREIEKIEINEALKLHRGLALLGEIEILPIVSQLSSEFVLSLCLEKTRKNRELLLELVRQGKSIEPEDLMDHLDKVTPFFSQLYYLALARHTLSRFNDSIYLESPNVLSYVKIFRPDNKGGIMLKQGFDIIINNIAIKERPDIDSFKVRLEQGILDTHAEALLMADGRHIENTACLFERTKKQPAYWRLIRDVNDPSWKEINLPHDTVRRIEQDLLEGYVTIVPQKPFYLNGKEEVGWWRIDPRSGETLGRMSSGEGQAMTEKVIILAYNVAWSALFWYCQHENLRRGICDPCLITFFSAFGFWSALYLRLVGIWKLLTWALIGVGSYGIIKKGGACVEGIMKDAEDYLRGSQ